MANEIPHLDRTITIPARLADQAERLLGLREAGVNLAEYILQELEEAIIEAAGESVDGFTVISDPKVPEDEIHYITRDGKLTRFKISPPESVVESSGGQSGSEPSRE